MSKRPPFFEKIRRKAASRWEQLEKDRELAAPWHQLFRQVQSPRHVLSELLQNADDVGATEATVWIEDGTFVFEHNGEDFTEEQFESLCRFGYSNKRHLHTIGFRGVGFKSTFSLGDRVEVYTPTLSIYFDRSRFTEPHWSDTGTRSDGKTCIRVVVSDDNRLRELAKNLQDWQQSPLSLLFFRHIRRLRVQDAEIYWTSAGTGPVPESEWMVLRQDSHQRYLLIRSKAEPFPTEVLEEIQEERMLVEKEEVVHFPPCKVEIVLGTSGRLYVVLPTGVETELPFACNAPFIQDPARLKIKDPEISPTNRWLLQRVGRLAAKAMLEWLNRSDIPAVERAPAYQLLPDVDREDSSREGVCGRIVEEAFEESIDDQPFLLTEEGTLVASGECIALPEEVLEIWHPRQVAAFLDEANRPVLSRYVTEDCREKLLNWRFVDEIKKQTLLTTLEEQHLPRPQTWAQLLKLWAYIEPEVTGFWPEVPPEKVRIVPVEGKKVLYAAEEVVRLGKRRLLDADDDWQFLAKHLLVLHHYWPRFLTEQRRRAEEEDDDALQESIASAYSILEDSDLTETASANQVIDRVAAKFFAAEDVSVADCVRLAHIAAKLGVTVEENFRYVTRDGTLRAANAHVLFDADGTTEELVPESKRPSLLLHPEYAQRFRSCTAKEWADWVASGKAKLCSLPPLVKRSQTVYGRREIEKELVKRGGNAPEKYPFKTDDFVLTDWDFDEDCWQHWEELASEDPRLWAKIVERLFAQPKSYWEDALSAQVHQVATTGTTRPIATESLLPSWILRLRDKPCLRDTRGICRRPIELLRRTPQTVAFFDVEPFVEESLDCEANLPLLELLGVRSTPIRPDSLLECLRSLAMSDDPPVHEVERWYRRLDQMMETCSTGEMEKIKMAFQSEKLILTNKGTWVTTSSVFLRANDEDVPDVELVRESVAHLTLWHKLGVAERPSADLVIRWLKGLPLGESLGPDDLRRAKALLARYPERIWRECCAWLNLAGEWVAAEELAYAFTMQSLIAWSHLHEWVKQKTADFRHLPVEVTRTPPFSDLPPLAMCVEDQFHQPPIAQGRKEKRAWATALGEMLCRVELETEAETRRVRSLAQQLANTDWVRVSELEVVPYIDGKPAGTPRRTDVAWLDGTLYVGDLSTAKLAKKVPEEIAKAFNHPEIKAALYYSFDRSPEEVRAYVEENFVLVAPEDLPEPETVATAQATRPPEESDNAAKLGTAAAATALLANKGKMQGGRLSETKGAGADRTNAQTAASMAELPASSRLSASRKPNIMERFAVAHGFTKESESRFFHSDGSWIAKTTGLRFPWERRTASGELVCYYLPKEHSLERKPLEIEAEVWALIEEKPDVYALILEDIQGNPIEVPGTRLRKLRSRGKLTLYPGTYRLVLEGKLDA